MWIDLDLLYSIGETSYQYFGCFIVIVNFLCWTNILLIVQGADPKYVIFLMKMYY